MSEVKTNKITSLASNNDITLDPDGTGDVVVAAGHSVGIGTAAPDEYVHIKGASGAATDVQIQGGDDTNSVRLFMGGSSNRLNGRIVYDVANNAMALSTNGDERLRVDSSGILLVGKTATNYQTVGVEAKANGSLWGTADGNNPLILVRKSSDGAIAQFYRDTTHTGNIGANESQVFISGTSRGLRFGHSGSDAQIIPVSASGQAVDDHVDLGAASIRFDDVYATTGTIQTSDQNEKQNIATLTTAETTAAKAISKLFKTFKWNSAVAAKGDAARTHSGVIAQEVQTAMSDAGLDASNYAFWCSDTWWETSTDVPAVEADEEAGIEAQDAHTRIDTYHTADEAPDGATQRTRMGIRYPELLAFVGAATEQRLADIETRLTALEA